MIDALRYEIARIRTIRSTWFLTGGALLLGLLIAGLMAFAVRRAAGDGGGGDDLDHLGSMLVTQLAATGQVPALIAFMLALIGILAWGHEYRHGMIRASLTALSSRTSFWIAKYVVVGAWVAVVGFAVMLLAGIFGQMVLGGTASVFDGETWTTIARTLIYMVLLTWLGMAFTSITRSQAFALVMLFLWPLLIENLITVLFLLVPGLKEHTEVTRFLPFRAGGQLLDVLASGGDTFGNPLSPLGGGLVFGGITAVLMGLAYALFLRRDA